MFYTHWNREAKLPQQFRTSKHLSAPQLSTATGGRLKEALGHHPMCFVQHGTNTQEQVLLSSLTLNLWKTVKHFCCASAFSHNDLISLSFESSAQELFASFFPPIFISYSVSSRPLTNRLKWEAQLRLTRQDNNANHAPPAEVPAWFLPRRTSS